MPPDRLSAARKVSAKRRPSPPPPPVDQAGRARILAAAIRSFSEAGYDGTTTAAVAREAGVTQPLVHHHFGSKQGLWRAAMDELFAEVRVFTEPNPAPLADRVLTTAEQFVRFVAARPEVTRVIAREGAAPSPRLSYLIDRYLRAPFRIFVDAIRSGQRAGLIDPAIRGDLLLFFFLGAGSHLFDVTALAQESIGIDATSARTREDFVVLVRELFRRGLFHNTRETT